MSRTTPPRARLLLPLSAGPATLGMLAVLAAGLVGRPPVVGASAPAASTTLVINEVDYRQPGAGPDLAEFVELKNVGTAPIDLAGYDLVGVDGQGTVYRRDAVATAAVNLGPGARYVVCGDAAYVANCQRALGATDVWRGGSGTGAFAIGLLRRGRADELVDSVAYEGVVGNGPNGEVWTETSPVSPADNDKDVALGIARFSAAAGQDGLDADVNSRDFSRRCVTPGDPNAGTQPPCQAATATPTVPPTATASPTVTPTSDSPATLTLLVNSAENLADPQPGDAVCNDGRRCTLRAAIQEANAVNHNGPILIRFARAMEILVPAGDALPALVRGETTISGVNPSANQAAAAAPAQVGMVWLKGPGADSTLVGLELNDTSGSAVQGLTITDFAVGVLVHGGGSGNVVGTRLDGKDDVAEGNRIAYNGEAQVRLGSGSGNVVAGNQLGLDPSGRPDGIVTEVGVDLVDGTQSNLVGQRSDDRRLFGRLNRIQWRHRYGVRLAGAGTAANIVSGNLIGADSERDPTDMANLVGVLLTDGATRNVVGGLTNDPKVNGNQIAFNLADGIQVTDTATGNTVAENDIHANRQRGIRLARTRSGGTALVRNSLTGNGGAAIVYVGDGYEPPLPTITDIAAEPVGYTVKGFACATCRVELFADPADEARTFLGATQADGFGLWTLTTPDALAPGDVSLAATAMSAEGATSRLSVPMPLPPAPAWFLRAVPPSGPRAIGLARKYLYRRYRLWNEHRRPEPDAEVRFTPLDVVTRTDEGGFLQVAIPLETAAAFYNQGISFTVEAVSNRDGRVHPVAWYPVMAIAKERPKGVSDVILDLSALGASGIGATLRRGSVAQALAAPGRAAPDRGVAAPLPIRRPVAARLAEEPAFGAAWTAAAVTTMREGPFAWQENIARGGALYELQAGSEALEGELEIRAPIAAWNPAGPASGCAPPGQGAVMCGWIKDKGCWVPVPGSSTSQSDGTDTIVSKATVSLPPAGGTFMTALQATTVFTLLTVGHDVAAPVITPTFQSGAMLGAFPEVLAEAVDEHAGVDATEGLAVLVNGVPLPVTYDMVNRRILVPPASRPIPGGQRGPADILIRVTDGFCNRTQVTVGVVLDPDLPPTDTPTPTSTATGSPSATPTGTGTGSPPSPSLTPTATATRTPGGGTEVPGRTIYLPFCAQPKRVVNP
jgi:hypothetical protein